MCYELNFATSSLYRTARYLAQARLVHQHLSGGSTLDPADQESLDRFFITENNQPDGQPGRARFVAKVPCEVRATTDALGRLETRLDEICRWSSARPS